METFTFRVKIIFGMQLCVETVRDSDALLAGAVAVGRAGHRFPGQCPSQEQGAQARQLLWLLDWSFRG